MPLNIADLELQIMQMADIAAIPDLLPDERSAKLMEYQSRSDTLAFEVKQILDALFPTDGRMLDYTTVRRLASLRRKHAMALKAAERIQDAISKAEQAERQAYDIPANVDCTTQSKQPLPKGKRKRRT